MLHLINCQPKLQFVCYSILQKAKLKDGKFFLLWNNFRANKNKNCVFKKLTKKIFKYILEYWRPCKCATVANAQHFSFELNYSN